MKVVKSKTHIIQIEQCKSIDINEFQVFFLVIEEEKIIQ